LELRVGVEELGSGDGCAGMRMVSRAGLEQFTNNNDNKATRHGSKLVQKNVDDGLGVVGEEWKRENGDGELLLGERRGAFLGMTEGSTRAGVVRIAPEA
jgi:hypothetical protein